MGVPPRATSDRAAEPSISDQPQRSLAVSCRPPLVPLTILCVASASLLLAACGGSSPSSTSSAAKEQQAEVKNADFAKCLREHGIEASTATAPGGGKGHGLQIRGSGGPARMEAAQKACKKYQPEPERINLSPQQRVEQEEAVQKFARCMREHGIKVEASASGGGVHIATRVHAGEAGAPNPESPAFRNAQQSCQKLLPFKGPHAGPPTAKPGGGESSETFATGG
jgi:hypothetical protein